LADDLDSVDWDIFILKIKIDSDKNNCLRYLPGVSTRGIYMNE